MSEINKLKIFNDPVYGFITIPNEFIYDLIQHPYFQRLRRISQMGLSYLVYPGAHHTRFHHALGCLHIMQKAINTLRSKEISITEEEENALYIAILLHDVGHGPFSHAMEKSIVEKISHESLSVLFMKKMNKEFNGKLDLAIKVFKGEYGRKFMLQLIASQLDMDRMDYLKRDSFYSGVAEGNINTERLIQMMNVSDELLVIEEKGIYSVEKFLLSRRLMYWQVYLHKTSLVAELILTKALKRAKELTEKGILLPCSQPLMFFLKNKIDIENFNDEILYLFSQLDDYDIISALKSWQNEDDFVLSHLSKIIINRDLPKMKISKQQTTEKEMNELLEKFSEQYNVSLHEALYFVFEGKIESIAYSKDAEPIRILKKDKIIEDVDEVSEQLNLKTLSKLETKYYTCFPKQLGFYKII